MNTNREARTRKREQLSVVLFFVQRPTYTLAFGRPLGFFGGLSSAFSRTSAATVDVRFPLAGEEIILSDVRVAHILRHLRDEHLVLGQVAALRVEDRRIVGD